MIRTLLIATVLFTGTFVQADEPKVIKLWPAKAPGEVKDLGPEKDLGPPPNQPEIERITNISEPTVTIYSPTTDKAKGAAVLVLPGGGYNFVSARHEGSDTCCWLNELGMTGVLLKYRCPKREGQSPNNLAALQDAQRAMSVLRSRAAEFKIEPSRIGILGFSAGGNLTVCTMQSDKKLYDTVDDADAASHKPDFAALIYPAYLSENGTLRPEYVPTKQTPPIFMAGTADDKVCNEGMPLMYLALLKAGVPVEMHLYGTGGHGYGMINHKLPVSKWPDRCADWLRGRGLLEN